MADLNLAWSFKTNTYECWKKLKSTLAVSNNSYQLSSHLESLTERCMYIWGKNYDEAVYWLQESCWRQSSNLSFACSIIFVFTIFLFKLYLSSWGLCPLSLQRSSIMFSFISDNCTWPGLFQGLCILKMY